MASSYNNRSSSQIVLITLVVFTVLAALATTVKAQPPPYHVSARSIRRARAPVPAQLRDHVGPDQQRPYGRRQPWLDYPHPECICEESRLSQAGEDIADLVRRTGVQETQSKENKEVIQTLVESNRQLQSQLPQVVSENQRLTRLTRSLRTDSSSLANANRQLRSENERLLAERDRTAEERDADPVPVPVPVQQRSSLHELNDVIGNREAEMMEMGLFPPVETPRPGQGRGDVVPGRRTFFASKAGPNSRRSDSEQIATSLLVLNQENANLARKIEQLEERIVQQEMQPIAGPQSRETVGVSSELSEKISQLERLVLVALQAPAGASVNPASGPGRPTLKGNPGPLGRQVEPDGGRLPGDPTARRIPGSESAVGRMTDDDLDAMANVVARVQNKSPRKSAFSVASTGVTMGANGHPRAIEFDHEYVNKGGDFKRRRSRFVCEHTGFYYITFTLRSYDGKYLGVALMKNSELQTAVYADSSDRNVMQTQSLLLHLTDGDELWLRHAPSENFAVHSGIHRFVTFSGFLIYRGN